MSEYDNDKKKGNKCSRNSMKRMLSLMLLCCFLPILLIVLLPSLSIGNIGINFTLISIITFLCPLMMLFMIPMMFKGSKDGKADQDEEKHI